MHQKYRFYKGGCFSLLLLTLSFCKHPVAKQKQATKPAAIQQVGVVKKTIEITDPQLKTWVAQANALLAKYDFFSPLDAYKVDTLHLPYQVLTKMKLDSVLEPSGLVDGVSLIPYLAEEIASLLEKILQHPDIGQYNLADILDLNVIISDDKRLMTFSLFQNTGGTYKSNFSWVHYRAPNGKIYNHFPADLSESSDSMQASADSAGSFNPDGYEHIYTLKTKQGIKYLLQGTVQGCNTCIRYYINLIAFRNGKMNFDFSYEVNTRGSYSNDGEYVEEGIAYNVKKRRIEVDYLTNDMTPDCGCEDEADQQLDKEASENAAHTVTTDQETKEVHGKPCHLAFVFNGKTFVPQNKSKKVKS